MTQTDAARTPAGESAGAERAVVLAAAVACGAIVANLYYAQPLLDLIAHDLGIAPSAASAVVALTQVGYAIGLLLLVPLVDLVESRRLMTLTLGLAAISLVVAAAAPGGSIFFAASLFVGIGSVAAQMLLPLVAGMAPEASRGRVVGTIMSGLLLGILLSRPVAGLVADAFGWRAMFAISAVLMAFVVAATRALIPSREPSGRMSYADLIGSLVGLLGAHRLLRRRAAYQAAMFAAFSMFWTAAPMRLSADYGFSHSMIGLFALAGAGGALIAPVAGRWADGGWTRTGTLVAIGSVAAGFAFAGADATFGFAGLLVGAIVLDMGVQANMIFGQRAIYAIDPAARGRINGLYVAILFLGGALGSSLVSPIETQFGWPGVVAAGVAFPALAFLFALFDRETGARSAN